ncbi:hypothetical protein ABZP36_026619 [Zizania latifolia]
MDNLISLVNKRQRACTALVDHGEGSALPTLWDSLPAIAVMGVQIKQLSKLLDEDLTVMECRASLATR